MAGTVDVTLSDKLEFFLTEQWRYKAAYGGRGSGKSVTCGKSLVVLALQKRRRILCTRELQNSIKDSVHLLLSDTISQLGVKDAFTITDNGIECANGSQFIFKGLRSNPEEIKSLEGVDICWVEEAQKVSQKSLDVLIPTIRKDDSEIWFTFNTGTIKDPVYEMFVTSPRENAKVVLVNYYDNPWFPDVLRQEMEYDRAHNPARYRHVWCGEPGSEGAFFVEFGEHLEEHPFDIQDSDLNGQLFAGLDSGITHKTVGGLYWVSPPHQAARWGREYSIHKLFTYAANGGTVEGHAREFRDRLESFPYTRGKMPLYCFADGAMWTKHKLSESLQRSEIDEYNDVFRGTGVIFTEANKAKEFGCKIMRQMFTNADDAALFRYWKGYNNSMVDGVKAVLTDENNPEIYAKQDGDDEADELRYALVKLRAWISGQTQRTAMSAAIVQHNRAMSERSWLEL
jgi:hypothetical protein